MIIGLPFTSNQEWIHDWSVSFAEPGYNMTDLQQVRDNIVDGITSCHPLNPGFNGAFEKVILGFVITNAEDEETCA